MDKSKFFLEHGRNYTGAVEMTTTATTTMISIKKKKKK